MNSDSDHHPWHIAPPGRKPPPGPERSIWLDAQVLFRNRAEIHQLLDDIHPALRDNQPAEIDPNVVSLKILECLEQKLSAGGQATAALIILCHLNAGFRRYCHRHAVAPIPLPLVQDLGLDDGLLDSDALASLTLHQAVANVWSERIPKLLATKIAEPHQLAGAIVVSAALFGGLAPQRFAKSLIGALSEPCQDAGGLVRFEWVLGSRSYVWLADPVTETLLRRWTADGSLPLPEGSVTAARLRIELAQYIPRHVAEEAGRLMNPAGVLSRAARGMLLQYFPPDIVTIAQGKAENTPLPLSAWSRVVMGRLCPRGETAPPIRAQPRQSKPTSHALRDGFIWEEIHALELAVAWSPGPRRKKGLTSSEEAAIRTEYVEKAVTEIAKIRRDVQIHYAERGEDGNACYSRVLCQFAEDLTSRGGPIRERLAPATISSYFKDITSALGELAVSDLRLIPVDHRQTVYHHAILAAAPGSREGLVVALRLFERTLIRSFEIDDEVDWSAMPVHRRFHLSVDANVVDATTYQTLWSTLKAVSCDEGYRPVWMSLALLLYRFGLRRGEAHELTLADIHFLPGGYVSLSIPVSRLTTNKSRQAKRQIGPVRLPGEEHSVLESLVAQRMNETLYRARLDEVYLFARPGYGSQLLDEDTLFRPITDLLHWASGDDSLRIHHFRHAFASRLFCTARVALTSLDEAPNRSAQWLDSFRRDGAWLRAYELGHASPRESTTDYCHTADLVHHYFSCVAVSAIVPIRTLSKLAGLADRSIERTALRRDASVVDPAHLLLETVRQRWPLAGVFDSSAQVGRVADSQAPVDLSLPPEEARHGSGKVGRFQDLLDIVRDRLRNRMDLAAWEYEGYRASQVRDWIKIIDRLAALGLQRAGRERRDRMPAELIQCGQRVFDALQPHESQAQVQLLTRCLVGFDDGRRGIRVDAGTAHGLKEWLEFRNEGLTITTEADRAGFTRIRLVGAVPLSPSDEKLFLFVLAVRILKIGDIEGAIQPYRRVRATKGAAA